MDNIQVLVGYIRPGYDCTQVVKFTGERLGEYTQRDNCGSAASIARLTQTLYRPAPGELPYVGDGIFVVHTAIETVVRDATTTRVYWLEEVNERDLLPSGGFEELGRACGFRQHLSLQEGLALSRERYRTLSLDEI